MLLYKLRFSWTESRARDTYGYNIVTLYVNGDKVARCYGGGYDMKGTVLAEWIETNFKNELLKLVNPDLYGLGYNNTQDEPKNFYEIQEKIRELEQRIDTAKLDRLKYWNTDRERYDRIIYHTTAELERYQNKFKKMPKWKYENGKTPTKSRQTPSLSGVCGFQSMESILNAIGLKFEWVDYNHGIGIVTPKK